MRYCLIKSTGEIASIGTAGDDLETSHFPPMGETPILNIPELVDFATHYYLGGEFHEFGAKPSDYHVWDWLIHTWRISDTASADQAAKELADKKRQRQVEVDAILVTTHTGNVFEGDEVSQGRMARAIIGMQTQPGITIGWVLANNIPTPVNAAELTEALALSGLAQAAIWSRPYE